MHSVAFCLILYCRVSAIDLIGKLEALVQPVGQRSSADPQVIRNSKFEMEEYEI